MEVQNITVAEAHTLLQEQKAVLIDVRETDEYHDMHIPGSQHIPLGSLTADAVNNPDTKKVIIHCRSGHRSHIACSQLLADNPSAEIYNLDGGIIAWKAAGYLCHMTQPNK